VNIFLSEFFFVLKFAFKNASYIISVIEKGNNFYHIFILVIKKVIIVYYYLKITNIYTYNLTKNKNFIKNIVLLQ